MKPMQSIYRKPVLACVQVPTACFGCTALHGMQQTSGPASTSATRLIILTCFDADLVSGRTNGADGPAPPGRKLLQAGKVFHK